MLGSTDDKDAETLVLRFRVSWAWGTAFGRLAVLATRTCFWGSMGVGSYVWTLGSISGKNTEAGSRAHISNGGHYVWAPGSGDKDTEMWV